MLQVPSSPSQTVSARQSPDHSSLDPVGTSCRDFLPSGTSSLNRNLIPAACARGQTRRALSQPDPPHRMSYAAEAFSTVKKLSTFLMIVIHIMDLSIRSLGIKILMVVLFSSIRNKGHLGGWVIKDTGRPI